MVMIQNCLEYLACSHGNKIGILKNWHHLQAFLQFADI